MLPTVALVWNANFRLVDFSVKYDRYARGLISMGYNVLTICRAGTDQDYPHPTQTYLDEEEICQPQFWRDLGCCGAVLCTWHRMTNVIQAIAASRTPVLAIAESDGRCSLRFHPWSTFQYMIFSQSSVRGRLGAAKHWLKRFFFDARSEHSALVDNTAAPDVITFAAEGAIVEFRRLLQRLHFDLSRTRIAWLPYPVDDAFCMTAVNNVVRCDRVIAVGRWDAGQKNAKLLADTARKLSKLRPQTEFVIVGNHSEHLAALSQNVPSVRVLGNQSARVICDLMASCRALIICSRWESGPIIAYEMLASGGTVVGTPIPTLSALLKDGQFGRLSKAYTAQALAAATAEELEQWERGARKPDEIAKHWRKLVSINAVALKLLALLGLPLDLDKSNLHI